jgi:selT/selW/selH-like putative selenoprotein
LKEEIEKQVPGTEVLLIEGSNGVFEVEKDNVLIFSKRKLGRFPEHSEVIEQLL